MELKALQSSPIKFRSALLIDADGQPWRLGDCLDDWQARDFVRLDPGWLRTTGVDPNACGPSRGYLERGRGASKTTDLAVMASWGLFASRRRLIGIAAAADQDQARLLRDSIDGLCRMNGWLGQILKVDKYKVSNERTGSTLEILASDVASSYGLTPDFCIIDELTYWQKEELWVSLFSAIAKRRNALLVCISNAGFNKGESWQWRIREAARTDESWYFHRLDKPPTWITPDRLAEQKRLLPPIAYRRLWLNEWTSGSGDALSEDDISRAIRLKGPIRRQKLGWQFFAGLDLGLRKDASALVTIGLHTGWSEEIEKPHKLSLTQETLIDLGLADEPEPEIEYRHVEGTGRMRVADVQVWHPKPGRKLDLEPIERAILDLDRRFRLAVVGYDPHQAEYLAERLRKQYVPVEAVQFVPANLQSMAQAVIESFNEGLIELFESGQGGQLVQDLRNLRIEERSYGIRLTSPRGPNGHGDAATALAIALLHVEKTKAGFTNLAVSRIIAA